MIENPMYTADPYDYDYADELADTYHILNEKVRNDCALRNHGRAQHGMNGKDADLYGRGQCVVTDLVPVDDPKSAGFRIDIRLRLYATICAPCGEGFNYEAVIKNASEEDIEYFASIDADPREIEGLFEQNPEQHPDADDRAYAIIDKLVEHYCDQATFIVSDTSGLEAQRGDPFAVMWNDNAWEGGIDITLSVPLTSDECEAFETHEYDDELLDDISERIATEIYDANKGGTPERDALKCWEEWVSFCNTEINKLDCYS
jgi:hypothetical protein